MNWDRGVGAGVVAGLATGLLLGWSGFVTGCGVEIDDPSRASAASAASSTAAAGGQHAGAGGGSTAVGSGGGASSLPPGLDELGTLAIMGDSLGDGGGEPPYYYALLRDALRAHYGASVGYHNVADSGSQTGALRGQVDDLPDMLAGPVAVVITSGGNDMKDNLLPILTGSDGPARTQMGDNISAALDALLEPGRFGDGVEVHVLYANIYDASDGQGNFAEGGCAVDLNSPKPTDPFFESWNGEIASRVAAEGQWAVDMHGLFAGHGFNNPPNWYAGDCTHPNRVGHDELHRRLFERITGQPKSN